MKLVSIRVAAERTGIPYSCIYSGCRRGQIPAVRIGHRWFVDLAKFEELFSAQREARLAGNQGVHAGQ